MNVPENIVDFIEKNKEEIPWNPHGMGIGTWEIWKEGNKDIRIHWFHEKFKNPKIDFATGSIHWHSFSMKSTVIKGKIFNVEYDFDNCFAGNFDNIIEPTTVGNNIYYAWEYINKKPYMVGEGFLKVANIFETIANKSYFMNPFVFHRAYPLLGLEAFTIIEREHIPDSKNIVLTLSTLGKVPPINGREKW